ncbi:GNAT family N-acetyltransferase [Mycolicibacterium brisbanense]|uniref:Putative acetyltransferase n=1 Tax=Mycolicibacterium brisbanense TaxID=146020 RepID=A0A100VWT9_9MYCO|nr:GNAT family N-acetyltransferase [Mycolicibacterium brisbanense]MCV7161623.1 GNAT family N-acetyltransferase [Mycolicibacterium brisbanense]GAS87403.1 putative acetyltransferase [Mycolicibacterium brisbanense]
MSNDGTEGGPICSNGFIRRAVPSDAASITRIVAEAYSPYIARIGRKPAPMSVDYHELVRTTDHVSVLQDAGDIVGVMVLVAAVDHLLIENVAVAPAAQGRGHGRVLLAEAECRARQLGYRETRLYTNVAMTENVAWYARLGYVEIERRCEDGFDRVFLAKALG